MPKVSVIIPTYNREKYIKEAIDSVLSQTFKDFEIIVVDDGSTDNTRELLAKYGQKIKYVYQSNQGANVARNTGIRLTKGEYIAFLDSDDLWLPKKLELQVNFLENNPELSMVYSNVYPFTDSSGRGHDYFEIVRPYSGNILGQLLLKNFIPGNTSRVRKDCFNKTGLFDETLSSCQDCDMWLRIAQHFKIGFIDKPLAMFRLHDNRITATTDDERQYRNRIKVIEKILASCPNVKDELGFQLNKRIGSLYFCLGCAFLKKNKCIEARKNLLRSIKLYPFAVKKYILFLFTFLPQAMSKQYKNRPLMLYEK